MTSLLSFLGSESGVLAPFSSAFAESYSRSCCFGWEECAKTCEPNCFQLSIGV